MLVTSRAEFQRAYDVLYANRAQGFLLDCESNGLLMWARENPARMCGVSLAPLGDPSQAFYFSFRHMEGENLPLDLLDPLRRLVAGVVWLGHNLSFDSKLLWCDGFALPPRVLDSMIAAHTANENERNFKLKDLCAKYFGPDAIKAEDELKAELKKRKLGKKDIHKLPASIVAPYAIADVQLAARLHTLKLEEMRQWRTDKAYEEICEAQLAAIRMEIRGIALDQAEVERQMSTIGPRQEQLLAELKELSGGCNPNSPKQLVEWLGLPKTDKEFLSSILEREPRRDVRTLLDYREVKKATSTYFKPFMELVDANGRIHTNFKVTGARTGRWSSNGPNMQNCSKDRATRSYSLKKCFTAAPGKFLFEADYSSVEPRLGAFYSRDPGSIDLFVKGLDYYRPTAAKMFRIAQDNVSDEQRGDAKAVALGLAYGMGSWKLAVKLNLKHRKLDDGSYEYHHETVWHMPKDGELQEVACSEVDPVYCSCEGKSYMTAYYDAVPDLQPCIKSVIATARRNDYIRYPLSGRTRRVEYFWNPERKCRENNTHKFYNYLLQGSAADIMRKALVAIDKAIPESDAALLLTVHDSIVCEVAEGPRAQDVCHTILDLMETTTRIDPVPLRADAKFGHSWGNMSKFVDLRSVST